MILLRPVMIVMVVVRLVLGGLMGTVLFVRILLSIIRMLMMGNVISLVLMENGEMILVLFVMIVMVLVKLVLED